MTRTLATALLAISLVSVEQEIEIGKKANAQLRREMPEFRDAETVTYIRSLGQKLTAHARGPKYPYAFGVVDYRELNAFALPGGPVWVHRGLLHAATNESQLAGVLAHEIAHISQRHAADQLTKATMASWGLGVMGALLGNDGGATTAKMAAGFLANGLFLKFSRDDEREADLAGIQMLTRAGWDARGMVELFETLRQEQKRDPGRVETFFSTHPSPQDRIRRLQQDVARARRGSRDSARFQAVRSRLLKMTPPKAMRSK
jgi:beta-barrel assembly-enhancing protease